MTKTLKIYSFDKNKYWIYTLIIFLLVIGPIIFKSILNKNADWFLIISSLLIFIILELIVSTTYTTIYIDSKGIRIISFTKEIFKSSKSKYIFFKNIKTIKCDALPFLGDKLIISEYTTYKDASVIYSIHLDDYTDFEKTLLEHIPKTCVVIGLDEEVKKYRK